MLRLREEIQRERERRQQQAPQELNIGPDNSGSLPPPSRPSVPSPQPQASPAPPPRARRPFARLLLTVSLTTLAIALIAAVIIAVFLYASQSTQTAIQVSEVTLDINATVAMIPAMLTPSPVPPVKLTPIECSDCYFGGPTQPELLQWVKHPRIAADAELTMQVKINSQANFVPLNYKCGHADISLSDGEHNFYDTINSRASALSCGTFPEDWGAVQFYYAHNELTVTAKLPPAAASHSGLNLCLWSEGMPDQQNRLLDCAPIGRP